MDKSEKFWDKSSKNYDSRATSDKTFEKTVELSNKHLKSSDVVLDFACATGLFSFALIDHVKEIHGFDISSKMIEIAKQKANELDIKNIDFRKTTIFDDTYKKGAFDVIFAFNILLYFKDMDNVLRRLNDLLKPGGLVISATGCLKERRTLKSYPVSFLISLLNKLGKLPDLRFLKIPELENIIKNGGFKIIESEILTDSPATEYYIVAKKG